MIISTRNFSDSNKYRMVVFMYMHFGKKRPVLSFTRVLHTQNKRKSVDMSLNTGSRCVVGRGAFGCERNAKMRFAHPFGKSQSGQCSAMLLKRYSV